MAMTVVDEKALGKRLQAARQAAGLTQQQLCHRAGLSYSTLAKIERGAIKSPSIFTIQQIAAALESSLDTLVGHAPTVASAKRRSQSGIRFVYFDINGCLVRFFHGAFTRIAEDSGLASDVVETTFWHYNDDACRGDMSLAKFNQILGKRFGLDGFDWTHYYLDAVEPITEMQELLRWAADLYQVGLLSNIMPGLIRNLRQRQIIPDLPYDAIVDSSEAHAIKPEAEIYDIAQAKAGVEPAEILLADDSRANLSAAERKGWHVLWFDDYRPAESAARVRDALQPEE